MIKPPNSALMHAVSTNVEIHEFDKVDARFDALENELDNLYRVMPFGLHSLDEA